MRKKVIIISLIIVIILSIIIFIYLNNRIIDDNSGFTLKDNLKTEVYTKANIKDYINTIEGKIIEEPKINTKKLGKQELTFIYLNKDNKKRRGTFEIEIVDTEKPLVWINSNYNSKVGNKITLEDDIICVDNYDNKPTCKIEGTYDINTKGTYNLTYIAKDSSNNTFQKDFTLTVYEPVQNSNQTPQTTSEPKYTDFKEVLNNYKNENTEIGIDVSKWQGNIDFTKVKSAGAEFVMIRVGSQKGTKGEYIIDPYFKQNIENALKNNLKVGIYFYSYADSKKEAKKQANWIIKQIKNYEIKLPIVFDFESFDAFNDMNLSLFGLNEVAESFINTINNAGYEGVLYGSKNYLNAIWKYHTSPVWLAHYTDKTDYDKEYFMWQMCDDGKIDGINGYVDIDILYKNSSEN